jgi:hypothetical protein
MSYAPLDDHFDEHPKLVSLDAAEMGVIACAITYATRNLSDGRVPRVWPERRFGRQGPKLVKHLVDLGIWSVRPDGDFEIVGFLDHNPSRADVLAKRAKRAEAGSKGGLVSWDRRERARAHGPPNAEAIASAVARPNALANGEAHARPNAEAGALAFAEPLHGTALKNQEKAEKREGSHGQDPARAGARGVPVSPHREPQSGAVQDPNGAAKSLKFPSAEKPETESGTRLAATPKPRFAAPLEPPLSTPEIETRRAKALRDLAAFDAKAGGK